MINEETHIISIVEDEIEIGSSLKLFINNHTNYLCDIHYQNGNDGVQGILSCKPSVVIMDIGLPDKSGVQCVKEIIAKIPDIKIIMFTVFDTDELLFEALKSGASGYILKDANHEEIVQAIGQALTGGAPMSPAIALKVIKSFKRTHVDNKVERLTDHQLNILKHISDGLLNKEIAQILEIQEGSVKEQVRRIYKKLQVNNRVEASNLFRSSK